MGGHSKQPKNLRMKGMELNLMLQLRTQHMWITAEKFQSLKIMTVALKLKAEQEDHGGPGKEML